VSRLTHLIRREKILGTLGQRQREVFDLLQRHGELTAWEMASLLGRPVYVVRPRITELSKVGLIRDVGARFHAETQRREAVWGIIPTDENGQMSLFGGPVGGQAA